jgi:hypothetical protein
MVRDLYPRMGFAHVREEEGGTQFYQLDVEESSPLPTKIRIERETHGTV